MIEDSEIILKAVGAKMTKENEEERPLLEVIRVGSFPMGTMLKGETALEMVLLCKEKPRRKIRAACHFLTRSLSKQCNL